jgi:hypothetical protein
MKRVCFYWIFIALAVVTLLTAAAPKVAIAQADQPVSPFREHYGELVPIDPPQLTEGVSNPITAAEQQASSAEEFPPCFFPDCWQYYVAQLYRNGSWDIIGYQNGVYPADPVHVLVDSPANDIQPKLDSASRRIAFTTNRDGNYEIYTIRRDRTDLKRLTNSGAVDAQPEWSPDDQYIVFVSERSGNADLWVMNADGTNPHALTSSALIDVSPSWSRNGQKIAWVRISGSMGQIWTMNADGSSQQPLTDPYPYLDHPDWSPDGTKIGFDVDINDDGWKDAVWMSTSGGPLNILTQSNNSGVTYPGETIMGSWTEDPEIVLVSYVSYVVNNSQLYLHWSQVDQINFSPPYQYFYALQRDYVNMEFAPHVQWLDSTPPTSKIAPINSTFMRIPAVINYSGVDSGPSGINKYIIDTTTDPALGWANFKTVYAFPPSEQTEYFSAVVGEKVYFRVRAVDYAGHEEAAHLIPDTFTTLYRSLFNGLVTDMRGVPLDQIPVTLTNSLFNLETGADGTVLAYTNQDFYGDISVTAPGYGAPPTTKLDLTNDSSYQVFLAPETNWIQSGGFENAANPLSDWDVSGSTSVGADYMSAHSGLWNLRIGSDGMEGYMTRSPILGSTTMNNLGLFVDPNDGLHAIIGLNYLYKPLGGQWSSPVPLLPSGFQDGELVGTFDADGNFHIGFERKKSDDDYSECDFVYMRKNAGGSWSSPQIIDSTCDTGWFGLKDIYATPQGEVKVLFFRVNQLLEMQRSVAGTWSSPAIVHPDIPTYGWFVHPTGKYSQTGALHLAYDKTNPSGTSHHVVYRARHLDGSFTVEQTVPADIRNGFIMELGPDDSVHLAWQEGYIRKDPLDNWSNFMPTGGSMDDMAIGADGTVIIVGSTGFSIKYKHGSQFAAYRDFPDGLWRTAITSNGQIHTLASPGWISGSTAIYENWGNNNHPDEKTAISQTITIPDDAHKPTLFFLYQTRLIDAACHSGLRVVVTPEAGPEVEFPQAPSPNWKPTWIDLSPWSGQTITLSFQYFAKAGEFPGAVHLDEIAAGEWFTPYPQSLSIARMTWPLDGPAQTILLGQNFMRGAGGEIPTVRLNGMLVDAAWIDENSLSLTVPGDIQQGQYTVEVTNPNGYKASLKLGLSIQKNVYLPVIKR